MRFSMLLPELPICHRDFHVLLMVHRYSVQCDFAEAASRSLVCYLELMGCAQTVWPHSLLDAFARVADSPSCLPSAPACSQI